MKVLDYFFPKQCINCGSFGEYLCTSCEIKYIERNNRRLCHACKTPIEAGLVHEKCRGSTYLDGVIVCCKYNKLVEKLVAELKYNFYTDIASYLIRYYLEGIERIPLSKSTILVPIPLFPRKEKTRGFNQAGLFAKRVANQKRLKYVPVLARTRNTKTQVGMSRAERIENLKDVFAINPKYLKSRQTNVSQSVILIDDVMTTGTTLEECAKVLKENEIKQVFALVFARG